MFLIDYVVMVHFLSEWELLGALGDLGGDLGGGEEEGVGKEWAPRWLGLPLGPEKAPLGCFLHEISNYS